MKKLAVLRPGAIGDIVCVINISEEIYNRYGHFDLFVFESYYRLLKPFVDNNCFKFTLRPEKELNRNEFEIVHPLIGYPFDQGYPKIKLTKHIGLLMAEELGIIGLSALPSLEVSSPPPPKEVTNSDYITIQVKTGWSRYKELSVNQNEEICNIVRDEYPFKIIQIGSANEPKLKGADYHILGQPLERSLGALAWASHHVGPDSLFNHASNFVWSHKKKKTKSLIYFGSTCPTGTGFESNVNLFLNLHCQPCYKENPEISANPGTPCPYNGMCLKNIPSGFLHSYLKKTFENL